MKIKSNKFRMRTRMYFMLELYFNSMGHKNNKYRTSSAGNKNREKAAIFVD